MKIPFELEKLWKRKSCSERTTAGINSAVAQTPPAPQPTQPGLPPETSPTAPIEDPPRGPQEVPQPDAPPLPDQTPPRAVLPKRIRIPLRNRVYVIRRQPITEQSAGDNIVEFKRKHS